MAVNALQLSQLLTQSREIPGVISPAIAAEMLRRGRVRQFGPGALVTQRGSATPRMAIVISGTVRLTAFFPNGREMLLHLIEAGDCWGTHPCLGHHKETNDGVTETEAEILLIEAPVVRDLMWEHRELQEAFVGVLCQRLNLATRAAMLFSVLDARQRMSWRLLMMARWTPDCDDDFRADHTLSQETLAAICQVSRQRANAILKDFETMGVITLRYGGLTISNPAALYAEVEEIVA